MNKTSSGNAEEVIGAAMAVELSIINGIIDLLTARNVITRSEMATMLQDLLDRSNYGEHQEMANMILKMMVGRFRDDH
jgi:hypothetical protein